MMKKFLLFAFLLGSLSLFSQNQKETGKFDVRFGAGVSILGNGDYVTFNYASELNYKISRYFTTSASFQYGKSGSDEGLNFSTASFLQGNLNIFISPFTNVKKQ